METIWAAVQVCAACVLVALAARWRRPALTFPATIAMSGVVLLTAAIHTSTITAILPALAILGLSWLCGEAVLCRLPHTANVPVVRIPIALALGLGMVGLALFLLAAVNQLNAQSVVLLAVVSLCLLLAIDHQRIREQVNSLRSWHPATPTLFDTVVAAFAVGLVTFSLLTAFVPENQSDAVRQHLPIAREIWQSGSAAGIASMPVSRQPMQGHLLFATAYGFGGMTAAKLLQSSVGLFATVGVAGMAWFIAGRKAALSAGVIFATMPLVLWELGHAFMDLFPVLFTVAAMLCILLWQEDGAPAWLIVAGALSGFGFVTKMNMGLVSVALAAGILLVGRASWQWRERILSLLVFALGNAVVVPWLIRTYEITGAVPGLSSFVNRATGILSPADLPRVPAPELNSEVEDAAGTTGAIGFGRSPLDLLRGLWILTFQGRELGFPIIGRGEIGILPLMLTPLALLGPRTRATAFLVVTAIVSYVGWWLTSFQIARHLLPTLAILAALCGVGFASALGDTTRPLGRTLASAAQAGFILGCIAVPFFWLASPRAQLPVSVVFGGETAAEYIEREITAANVLAAASAMLPADTPVGYVSVEWEGPQLYTDTRLVYFPVASLGATPDEVIASLSRMGVRYFIWDRAKTNSEQWRSTLLSGEFLSNDARVLATDHNVYLFEIDPILGELDQRANLLLDPALEEIAKQGSPWAIEGTVERAGALVAMEPRSSIRQQVHVTGGDPYLLLARGSCASADERADLTLEWYDEHDALLGSATEAVLPGTKSSEQFLWRMAPERATSVSAKFAVGKESACEVAHLELYDLAGR